MSILEVCQIVGVLVNRRTVEAILCDDTPFLDFFEEAIIKSDSEKEEIEKKEMKEGMKKEEIREMIREYSKIGNAKEGYALILYGLHSRLSQDIYGASDIGIHRVKPEEDSEFILGICIDAHYMMKKDVGHEKSKYPGNVRYFEEMKPLNVQVF